MSSEVETSPPYKTMDENKHRYVYIMTNKSHTTVYVGVTSDIARRVAEHRSGTYDGFTKWYRLHCLAYYEEWASIDDAITREKQLKKWNRSKKDALVETMNPEWRDLAADWGL